MSLALPAALERIGQVISNVLISPGSTFSLLSLACATLVSVAFLLARKPMRPRLLLRALWPKRLFTHRSTRLDFGLALMNIFVTGTLIGWALISASGISQAISGGLTGLFGHSPLPAAPEGVRVIVLTVVLFLAYDFAYWIDHYLKHKVPALWEFHRVHHTAEVLTPLTAFRMHPIDSLIFANIVSAASGLAGGTTLFLLGAPAHAATIGGTNLILVIFLFGVIHLQHSHIDIRFTGWLGRVLFSPAHHHIHHSSDPAHYDANLGSCLAVWDDLFGTLIMPAPHERPGRYGAEAEHTSEDPHSAIGSLIVPFGRAFNHLAATFRRHGRAPQPGE